MQAGLTGWIGHYNANRPHSKLGGKTPSEVYFAPPGPPNCPNNRDHLTDLATLTRNTIVTAITPKLPITVLVRPTAVQQRTFDLLEVAV